MRKLVFLAADIGLILLAIVLLWFEVRPQATKTLAVRTVSGTHAKVATVSVQQALVGSLLSAGRAWGPSCLDRA